MTQEIDYSTITSPEKLKQLNSKQLAELADFIRDRIIQAVSSNGGHLASNLGITELTIALHYVFNFANDRLTWDVGHQCYAHKFLTGRGDKFNTLRKKDGLSGFPSPDESDYDLFFTGHAGTAISTAAGLAIADQKLNRDNKAVAVVGDASIVNGLSLEGLNNAALLKRQFLVVLNDNSMAIDRTKGGLAEALERVRLNHTYNDIKNVSESILNHLPLGGNISDALANLRKGLKATIHKDRVFETLGFNYFGPINGHDVKTLVKVLQRISQLDRPTVLHIHTEKGKGCAYAVENPCRFHSPAAHIVKNGKVIFEDKPHPTWTQTFAETLIRKAKQDDKIVAITAAMPDGTGLAKFRQEFPDRTIDVGISESHAVACAAGLAKAGLKPVVAIYSTFMQRAFDQIFHECSLQKLPVIFCMDRAGMVGSDGAVHHGLADIAMFRPLPGVEVIAPADASELDSALDYALKSDKPIAIRYPRDEVPEPIAENCPPFETGKSRTVSTGKDATIISYGTTTESAIIASEILAEESLSVGVVNARFAKPLDQTCIAELLKSGKPIITLEDHAKIGGFGSAVVQLANDLKLDASNVTVIGVPDQFYEHASRFEQLDEIGLTPEKVAQTVREIILNSAK